eukprot:TRINITY_DN29408_c0_g1_i1.p1 TRINITY_DN29408_c0_g1~~TRINITY_DN29408_c0_g1_i1.p1  ORF type:complete len:376 (-),score=68.75 TRINITY_DN29408_c0_g1_i1:109-1236(-)
MSAAQALDDLKSLAPRLSKLHTFRSSVLERAIDALPQPLGAFLQDRLNILRSNLGELRAKLHVAEDEVNALKEAHQRQQDLLEELFKCPPSDEDAVRLVFQDDVVVSSRALLSRWSPALKALLLHGNSLAGNAPRSVEVHDFTAETFRAALQFRCSGRFCSDLIDEASTEHSLLQFSDYFDLQDLKTEYLAAAEKKVPLTPRTAKWHLSLACKANDSLRREKARRALVSAYAVLCEEFPHLDLSDAMTILEHDELRLPLGAEHAALLLFSSWALHAPERLQQSLELLGKVRLSLLTVKELSDFQQEVQTEEKWMPARNEVLAAIRSAMESKLVASCARKRKHTVVDDGTEEQNNLKIMRIARDLFAEPRRAECTE